MIDIVCTSITEIQLYLMWNILILKTNGVKCKALCKCEFCTNDGGEKSHVLQSLKWDDSNQKFMGLKLQQQKNNM